MGNIGIIGDTGIVGRELEALLEGRHNIVFRENSGRKEGKVEECDLVFLATKAEVSMDYAPILLEMGIKVIDTSAAFRLPREQFERWYGIKHKAPELIEEAAYGLPAYYKSAIEEARLVANPGCYPTAIILAIRPLEKLLKGTARVVATSGNTGAGKDPESDSNEVRYAYGKKHRHTPEIQRYSGFDISFTSIVLRSVARGINANIEAELSDELKQLTEEVAAETLRKKIRESYEPEDMVTVVKDTTEKQWGTRDVNKTHKALIKIEVDNRVAYICSMIDNLRKGAASQAVENMNIMLGLPRLYGIDNSIA